MARSRRVVLTTNRRMGVHVKFWYSLCKVYEAHYIDIIMSAMASQITSVSMVCSTVCSGVDQRKHQSSASLAFVRGIFRWPVNSPLKVLVTPKMFPLDDDDVIMSTVFHGNKFIQLIRLNITEHTSSMVLISRLSGLRRTSSVTLVKRSWLIRAVWGVVPSWNKTALSSDAW